MTHYINTDLDLVSADDLTSFAEALESKSMFTLHVAQGQDGLWWATFETGRSHKQPEPNIVDFLNTLEALGKKKKKVLSACTLCVFDLGYECGSEPRCFQQEISNATLQRVADIGATLRITLYPENTIDSSAIMT